MKALLIALALLQAPTDTLPDLSRPWSLPQCIHWALEHNLSVAQQEATLERSAIDEYCRRFNTRSRSALLRESIMERILSELEENHPTLF